MHDLHKLADITTEVIAGASVVHNLLPPYDWEPDFVRDGLTDFPAAQAAVRWFFRNRWYKLLVYTTGYIALNARSKIWKSAISIENQLAAAKATGTKEGIASALEAIAVKPQEVKPNEVPPTRD